MTLIELMVGLAIIAIIMVVAVGGIQSLLDSEMKSAASTLASTIRYLYNKSATERLYIRIIYDMDEHSYKVESTTKSQLVASDESASQDEEGKEEEEKKSEAFSVEEDYLLKPMRFPSSVRFKDIQTAYSKERVEKGRAYTYFFPNGVATHTVINLTDEDDEVHYSLEVFPLSGRVRIESEYKELKNE